MTEWRLNPSLHDEYIRQTETLVGRLDGRWSENGRPMKYVWAMPNWYDAYESTINSVTKSWAQWVRLAPNAHAAHTWHFARMV